LFVVGRIFDPEGGSPGGIVLVKGGRDEELASTHDQRRER
jgi:hypothetical protein